jgi:hypothetical protein
VANGPAIAVFGAESSPEAVVSKRVTKLVEAFPAWTLLLPTGKRSPWRLHDWALHLYQPVQYFGTPGQRFYRKVADAMVRAADQVLVFEQRGGKRFDHVIALGRSGKRKLALELYDIEDDAGRQLSMV